MMDFNLAGRVSLPAYFFVIEDPDGTSTAMQELSGQRYRLNWNRIWKNAGRFMKWKERAASRILSAVIRT